MFAYRLVILTTVLLEVLIGVLTLVVAFVVDAESEYWDRVRVTIKVGFR